MSVLTFTPLKRIAIERPITTFCVVAIGLTLPLQTALLLAGLDVLPRQARRIALPDSAPPP